MMYRYLAVFVVMCALLGSCRKASPKAAADFSWTPTPHEWIVTKPLVKVCATAPVTTAEVQVALDLWAEKGAPQLLAVPSHCFSRTELHTVYVDVPSQYILEHHWNPQTIGLTSVFSVERDGPAAGAYISLLNDDMRILVHEVGHLWIGDHYPAPGHVLSEYVDGFSWDGWDGVARTLR